MSDESTQVNTICPVCGQPVQMDMPPITPDPQFPGHQAPEVTPRIFRVCSSACALMTEHDPERYRVAAESNAVARPAAP